MLTRQEVQLLADVMLTLASLYVILYHVIPALRTKEVKPNDFVQQATLGSLKVNKVFYFMGNPTDLLRKVDGEHYVYLDAPNCTYRILDWTRQVVIEEVMQDG